MYYLNTFNEMLKKRQQQNMMGGGGNDYGVGTTAPSGPMGLGPAQDRNAFRDTLNSMSPMSRFAMGMMPVVGPAFNVGRLANAGISAYQSSQLAPSRGARERSQDQFRVSEISDMNAPMQNTAQQSFRGNEIADSRSLNTPQQSFRAGEIAGPEYGPAPTGFVSPNAYEGAMAENSFNAFDMGGNVPDDSMERLSAPSTPSIVGGSIAPSSISGESLAPSFDGSTNTSVFDARTSGESATADTGNPFDGDAYGGSYQFAHGGMVHAEHLKGRAPAPDDGYGALQGGEYVITKAAVEKYGKRLLDAINNGTFR